MNLNFNKKHKKAQTKKYTKEQLEIQKLILEISKLVISSLLDFFK